MGHPKRYFEHKSVYFLTDRLARGLPFVPCGYINKILLGIMAKASERYPDITICNYLWMSNHYHMTIVTNGNPAEIAGFMNIINGEAAKAVVRLLGLKNVKVWAQRYNPIRLLTPEDVVKKTVYLYLNPVTANLVEKVQHWPGVSSFEIKQKQKIKCEYTRPSKIQKLPRKDLTNSINKKLLNNSKIVKEHYLTIDPYAWIDCFENPNSLDSYALQISSKIALEEKTFAKRRKNPVMGVTVVKTQNPYQDYRPKSKGRRMFCISSCLELRKQYIKLYKDFCERCCYVWQKWKEGCLDYKYPPGAFPPPIWPLSNVLKFQT